MNAQFKLVNIDEIKPFLLAHKHNKVIAFLFDNNRLRDCDGAIIALVEGQIVGLATISVNGELAEGPSVTGFYLLKTFRGQGIGKQLMRACLIHFQKNGQVHVTINAISKSGWLAVKSLIAEFPEGFVQAKHFGNLIDTMDAHSG